VALTMILDRDVSDDGSVRVHYWNREETLSTELLEYRSGGREEFRDLPREDGDLTVENAFARSAGKIEAIGLAEGLSEPDGEHIGFIARAVKLGDKNDMGIECLSERPHQLLEELCSGFGRDTGIDDSHKLGSVLGACVCRGKPRLSGQPLGDLLAKLGIRLL